MIKFACNIKFTAMRIKAIFSTIMILASCLTGAQEFKTIYGKVVDADDGEPLYLASIDLAGTNISNVTNTEGVFSLKIPADTKADATVRVTYMGYDRFVTTVSAFDRSTGDRPLRIRLQQSLIPLSAAMVIDMDAAAMFEYAYSRSYYNYPQEYEAMTAFYRETVMKDNSKYLSMNEAVLDISKTPYRSGAADKAGIYKGRGSKNYDASDSLLISYKGGVTASLMLDMVKNPFAGISLQTIKEVHRYYNFRLGLPSVIDGKSFQVIEFSQNPLLTFALYRGRVYIDPETYAIARVELDLNVEGHPEIISDYVRKIPKNTRMEMVSASYIINYKESGGLWYYDYSRSEITISARKRYSPFRHRYRITSELAVTDHYPGKLAIEDDSMIRFGDIMASKLEAFTDEDFWGSYNIIEPDKSIDVILRRIVRQLRRREQ